MKHMILSFKMKGQFLDSMVKFLNKILFAIRILNGIIILANVKYKEWDNEKDKEFHHNMRKCLTVGK